MDYLKELEAEAIYIIREAYGQFKKPVILYSVGKDSTVLLHLVKLAFAPQTIPIPILFVDTGYKFPEMYEFKKKLVDSLGVKYLEGANDEWLGKSHPDKFGMDKCCGYLKTQGLLQTLNKFEVDAAFGGARRDEEKSRAKERIFSVRDKYGQWNPKSQRPELWNHYNGVLNTGEVMRIFPISNWSELDIWRYIDQENIPIVDLYLARKRKVVRRGQILFPLEYGNIQLRDGEKEEEIMCRFRSIGCVPCTGAIESTATTVKDIIKEIETSQFSERQNRAIDHTSEASMEEKKRQGYF